MTTKELGKRIKEARLAKKMTQSEVVGTFITRNMLSQIESGTASPSIKTLEYLSKALDIPMNQLMSDEASDISDDSESPTVVPYDASIPQDYISAKKSYIANDFVAAIEILEHNISVEGNDNPVSDDILYDEMTALLAITCYRQADASSLSHSYKNAIHYAKKAIEYSSKGIFANSELKTRSLLLLEELLNRQLSSDDIHI